MENLCDVDQREQGIQDRTVCAREDHIQQSLNVAAAGCQFTGTVFLEEGRRQGKNAHHDCCPDLNVLTGADPL